MADLHVTLQPLHEKQKEVLQNDKRFKILNWGRRTGKSVFSITYTVIRATQDVGRYWIVAPTYKQAKNIYWRDLVLNFIPTELIAKKNESELIIYLINGSIIELKGADDADSLRGSGIKGLILDEYAFMKPNVWNDILRPMLVVSKGWAIFISTPNGFNHFYDLCEIEANWGKDPDWMYSHATMYDNPHIDPVEIDKIKEKTDEDTFAREYLADFRQPKGLVYKMFDRDLHVKRPKDVPENGTFARAIDFGFTNPFAVLFVLIDYDDNWWIYDEIYQPGLNTEQAVKAIEAKSGTHHYTYTIGDSAAAQEIANFRNNGLYVTPCKKEKDSIIAGIRKISDKLKVQGNGQPKLFVTENCVNTIFEFQSYAYPEGKDDKNASELPQKVNDHAMDALRYLALSVFARSNVRIYKPTNKAKLQGGRKR